MTLSATSTLGQDALESALRRVREQAAGPDEGVFGPNSMSWRVNREAAVFLGAGRALLMQLAHPWVAAAIAEHSDSLVDPIGRFHRTFATMYTLSFGTTEQALAAARRLHRRHGVVSGTLGRAAGPFAAGTRYAANDVSALHWVHATLVDTALKAHALALTPLSPEDRERYYAENRLFAALFAIPDAAIPATWTEFEAYKTDMLSHGTLTVTPEARAIADALLSGGRPRFQPPRWYRALTASILPPKLRTDFRLDVTEVELCRARTALARIRRLYPLLPHRLRFVGPYQEAIGRLQGRSHPDFFSRCANRLWIGRASLDPDRSTPRTR